MKNSQTFWNDKNEKVEVWHEDANGITDYWMKVNGVSESITKKKYDQIIKNNNLKDLS